MKFSLLTLTIGLIAPLLAADAQTATWRGLTVASEVRCAPYDSAAYGYSQALERLAISAMGGRIYGPYSGRTFAHRTDTDIEYIVARSEAHDSGLCAANHV